MRIETPQAPEQGVIKIKAGTGTYVSSLNEGQRLRAEVLSRDKGTVVMKADGGQTFRARLEAGVALSPGDKVLLEVTGGDAKIISMAIREETSGMEDMARAELVRDFDDKTLLPYASKLADMNMPVTEDAARTMKEITARNPEISLDEAAFIASNKLAGDESLVSAALSMLAEGDKTGEMLARLLALLLQPPGDDGGTGAQGAVTEATGGSMPEADAAAVFGLDADEGSMAGSPLTDWLALVESGETDAAEALLRGEPDQFSATNGIITQYDDIMQNVSTNNVEKYQDETALSGNIDNNALIAGLADGDMAGGTMAEAGAISAENAFAGDAAGAINDTDIADAEQAIQNGADLADTAAAVDSATLAGINGNNSANALNENAVAVQEDNGAGPMAAAARDAADAPAVGASAAAASAAAAGPPAEMAAQADDESGARAAPVAEANKAITGMIMQLDEFKGVPEQILERFSDMLLRISKDNAQFAGGENEKLADILEKMFVRMNKTDMSSGERIKNAKEELYARLALLEEEISRSSQPARTELAAQTQKLMDHARLMNNIEQFAYYQLPYQVLEERKTAELYIFKKKGSKRVDPDNVNILLALDLEHMGHWEGLINLRDKDVSIRMEVRGAQEKEFFSEKTVMLHEMLAEVGFKLTGTDITVSEVVTTPLNALSAMDRYARRAGSIDYMV
ncbi:MAG: hypothetical protein FWH33_05520 [Oscillospiraceae bacterium]|nr:hypothetical protein [Oscillospiraceae bacterium]